MSKPWKIKSRAEILFPPSLAISGHNGAYYHYSNIVSHHPVTSSQQHCVCVRVWYWACLPVMWRWSVNITIYINITLSHISKGMMPWQNCACLWSLMFQETLGPPSDRYRSHLPASRRSDSISALWVTQSPAPRSPCQHSIYGMIWAYTSLRKPVTRPGCDHSGHQEDPGERR